MARAKKTKSIVYQGVKLELEDFSEEVRGNLKKLQKRGLAKGGTKVVKAVKNAAPKRTGALRKSVKRQVKGSSYGVPFLRIGTVNSKAKYAHLIEFGTGYRWNKKQNHSTGKGREYAFLRDTVKANVEVVKEAVNAELSTIGPGVLPNVPDNIE